MMRDRHAHASPPDSAWLALEDHPDEVVERILARAERLARGEVAPAERTALAGKVVGLVFFDPSLRTRVSMERAAIDHGGAAIVLEPGRNAWPIEVRRGAVMDGAAAEHVVEAAGVLGRYADALGVRAFPRAASWDEARRDDVLRAFAEYAGVAVINLEGARRHPCQELADGLTLRRAFGGATRGRRFVLAWCWHPKPLPTAVPASACLAAARAGMDVVLARPEGYDLDADDLARIEALAARHGGSLSITGDLDRAIEGADVVYAKSWGSLLDFGDAEREAARRAPLRDWRIDGERMRRTREAAGRFMHCLPVRRNVVATDEVLDGPQSIVLDQAENRLHAQRALLLELLAGPA